MNNSQVQKVLSGINSKLDLLSDRISNLEQKVFHEKSPDINLDKIKTEEITLISEAGHGLPAYGIPKEKRETNIIKAENGSIKCNNLKYKVEYDENWQNPQLVFDTEENIISIDPPDLMYNGPPGISTGQKKLGITAANTTLYIGPGYWDKGIFSVQPRGGDISTALMLHYDYQKDDNNNHPYHLYVHGNIYAQSNVDRQEGKKVATEEWVQNQLKLYKKNDEDEN